MCTYSLYYNILKQLQSVFYPSYYTRKFAARQDNSQNHDLLLWALRV